MRLRFLGWVILSGLGARAAAGQESPRRPGSSWVEVSASAQAVTHDFGDWYGAAVTSAITSGARDVWYLDGRWQQAFGDRGVFGSAALTHVLSDDWFVHASVGAGTGAFFFPDLRVDLSIHRKWLRSKRLVTNLGITFVDAKDVHQDRAVFGSVTGYLAANAVVEGGVRINWSRPGNVSAARVFGALTLGREGERYLTARLDAGRESYQLIGPTNVLNAFNSTAASVGWREWLGRRFGLDLGVEWYHNPFYDRTGARIGLIRQW